jgi:diacylglycerol O-acyltransferase
MSHDRLSSLDAAFLDVESSTAHMHVGWAALFQAPEHGRRPTFRQLRDHVGRRLHRAPRYRQRLAEAPLAASNPVWVDDERFDLARHVRHSRVRNFGDVVDSVLSTPLERDRPMWELWIADRLDDGRIGVLGKVHHCMVDGLAAVELAALLLDPSPDPEPVQPDRWRPDDPPVLEQLVAQAVADRARWAVRMGTLPVRLAAQPRRVLGAAQRGLAAVRAAGHSVGPAPAPTSLNPPLSGRRHLAGVARPLDDLRRIARRHGATVNDVVLAVSAGALRRFMRRRDEPPTNLKTMVPVSRRSPDAAGGLGNDVSFVFVDLPCEEPDPVRRVKDVQAAMSECKDDDVPEGAGAMLDAFGQAPRPLRRAVARAFASPRAFNLTVSNIPGPPQPLYMRGCRLDEVYPVVPLAERHAASIGMTTVNGRSFFGVYADQDSLPDADLIAEGIDESVEELLARS